MARKAKDETSETIGKATVARYQASQEETDLIDDFMSKPENADKVYKAIGHLGSKPRAAFMKYAIAETIRRAEFTRAPRVFGTGIEATVNKIIADNEVWFQKDPENMHGNIMAITASYLRERHNPNTVKKWLEVPENQAIIDSHHTAMNIPTDSEGITKYNRIAGKARKRIEQESNTIDE